MKAPACKLTGSAANILAPETTAYLQRSSEVDALLSQGCFGRKKWDQSPLGRKALCYESLVYITS